MAPLPPSPFITHSATPPSPAVADTAGVSPRPPDAPAGTISVSDGEVNSSLRVNPARAGESELSVMLACSPSENLPTSSTGGPQEAPAPRCTEPHNGAGALGMIDCIHEIFFYARKLMKGHRASMCPGCENPEFAYETVDGGAMYRCADCGKSVHFSGADLAAASTIDEAAFEASIDEVPLFLREDGYLQRREA